MSAAVESRAAALVRDALVVDMVFPYEPELGNGTEAFGRWRDAGFAFLSVHPAGDRHTIGEAMRRIAAARRDIDAHPDRLLLAETVDDVRRAKAEGRLAVGLHVEGCRLLERDVAMVEVYYRLGIRFCHPVFNVLNEFGGGCADPVDPGMTAFGAEVLAEMNRVGMIPDGAHVGHRTTLDMLERSTRPVIFSHNGVHGVHPHFRNVRDDQIDGCARTGGVIGISGMNNYLGGPPNVELLVRHVDYIAERVGAQHVALGLDVVGDAAALSAFVSARPAEWPGRWAPFEFAGPELVVDLADALLDRGYAEQDVRGILGGNALRVCEESWR